MNNNSSNDNNNYNFFFFKGAEIGCENNSKNSCLAESYSGNLFKKFRSAE